MTIAPYTYEIGLKLSVYPNAVYKSQVNLFFKIGGNPLSDTCVFEFSFAALGYYGLKLTTASHLVLEYAFAGLHQVVDLTPSGGITFGSWFGVTTGWGNGSAYPSGGLTLYNVTARAIVRSAGEVLVGSGTAYDTGIAGQGSGFLDAGRDVDYPFSAILGVGVPISRPWALWPNDPAWLIGDFSVNRAHGAGRDSDIYDVSLVYSGSSSDGLYFAEQPFGAASTLADSGQAWIAAIIAPPANAPTYSRELSSPSGTLTASTIYQVVYTNVAADGRETTASPPASFTFPNPAGSSFEVNIDAPLAGGTQKIYVKGPSEANFSYLLTGGSPVQILGLGDGVTFPPSAMPPQGRALTPGSNGLTIYGRGPF